MMIKIMDTSKTLEALVNDRTNGLGQIQPINAFVTEELNGVYEAELSVASTDKHFNDLSVGGILKMPVNEAGNEQLFRINAITKPMNSICTLECSHISYDLNKVAVKPFTATGSVSAANGMVSNIIGSYPFTMTTNISNTTSKFTLDIPRSFRECLGGYEGSLLDVFRGEYEYDNLEVKMLAHRGSDNGVRISYGKNLTDFVQDEQMDNVFTSVLGYAVVDDVSYTGNVYHKVQSAYPKVMIVDFSADYETGTVPTVADLTAKARAYAEANDIEVPNVSMEISFVPLYQTEEYKNIAPLERVSLGDTVHVYFEKLGVEATARVIQTVWNVLANRYESVELGDAKANLNTIINEVTQQTKSDVAKDQGFLEGQLNQMASLIINGLGLHRTIVPVDGGGYRIYLHNKPTLAESDTQYIFTAEGFLVSTDYGQTWNAGFDAEGNAVLNSLATITLKALEINGSTINGTVINGATISFGTQNSKKVTAYGDSQGIVFDGTGMIKFETLDEFRVTNSDSSDVNSNQLRMTTADGKRWYEITNFDENGNYSAQLQIYNSSTVKQISMDVYDDTGGSLPIARLLTEFDRTTGKPYILMALYERTSASSVRRSAGIDIEGKNVTLYGDKVYFNGVQKW
jgi:phage minor structural protein